MKSELVTFLLGFYLNYAGQYGIVQSELYSFCMTKAANDERSVILIYLGYTEGFHCLIAEL